MRPLRQRVSVPSGGSKMASDRSHSLQPTYNQCRRGKDWRACLELVCTFVALLQPLARADDFAVTRPGEAHMWGAGAHMHACTQLSLSRGCVRPSPARGIPAPPLLPPPASSGPLPRRQSSTCKATCNCYLQLPTCNLATANRPAICNLQPTCT